MRAGVAEDSQDLGLKFFNSSALKNGSTDRLLTRLYLAERIKVGGADLDR